MDHNGKLATTQDGEKLEYIPNQILNTQFMKYPKFQHQPSNSMYNQKLAIIDSRLTDTGSSSKPATNNKFDIGDTENMCNRYINSDKFKV